MRSGAAAWEPGAGLQDIKLQVLLLDYNHIGDEGAANLAAGSASHLSTGGIAFAIVSLHVRDGLSLNRVPAPPTCLDYDGSLPRQYPLPLAVNPLQTSMELGAEDVVHAVLPDRLCRCPLHR